jgi:hypothetical protein
MHQSRVAVETWSFRLRPVCSCDVTDLRVQEPVDHRVYVFIGRERTFAGREPCRHTIQTGFDATALLERENACVPQRDSPRLGQPDVERPEAVVRPDRTIDGFERRGGAPAEPTTPELVRRRA